MRISCGQNSLRVYFALAEKTAWLFKCLKMAKILFGLKDFESRSTNQTSRRIDEARTGRRQKLRYDEAVSA